MLWPLDRLAQFDVAEHMGQLFYLKFSRILLLTTGDTQSLVFALPIHPQPEGAAPGTG